MNSLKRLQPLLLIMLGSILLGCAVSAETQAKIDEFNRTIPTCSSVPECQSKWGLANAWVEANADFGIRLANEERIVSTTTISSDSGIGIQVNRQETSPGEYLILVELECIQAYGCLELWDLKLDFNRVVNGAR